MDWGRSPVEEVGRRLADKKASEERRDPTTTTRKGVKIAHPRGETQPMGRSSG